VISAYGFFDVANAYLKEKGVTTMRKFMLVAAIASLSIVNAGAALAQAAVGELGLAAFNHPDADILHAGPGYAAEPRNALASVPVVRHMRGHKHGRTR
jgi:hypothetical protein